MPPHIAARLSSRTDLGSVLGYVLETGLELTGATLGLLTQLVGLERRTARGGRDSIDHPPGAHDDLANAVAGLAAVAKRGAYDSSLDWVSGPDPDKDFQRQ